MESANDTLVIERILEELRDVKELVDNLDSRIEKHAYKNILAGTSLLPIWRVF